jgi:hypothetical protein
VCTLSWTPLPGGYALAMSRDERRTRARALPPARMTIQAIPVLMPIDPEGGGSWVSVNAQGLSLALLNRYEESPQDLAGPFTSRGLLVRELAWAADHDAVARGLGSMGLGTYRPFTLVAVGSGRAPHLFDWDGSHLTLSEVTQPGLVRASSGSNQVEAERERNDLFRAAAAESGRLSVAAMERLHRSHLPQKGPLSICMHRDEATTVSLSLITVFDRTISILYVDGPPGETEGGTLYSL